MTTHHTAGYEKLDYLKPNLEDGDELIVVTHRATSVAGIGVAPYNNGVGIRDVGSIPWRAIAEVWRKPRPCPHDTLRRKYDEGRATVYFICATDSNPECHETFLVDSDSQV